DPALPAKLIEEIDELRRATTAAEREDELGDVLFMAVNWSRHLKVDPETALRKASAKFASRFRAVEELAATRGTDMRAASFADLDALWEEAKGRVPNMAPPSPLT